MKSDMTARQVSGRTTLPRSGLELSRIGLGLAHLHLLMPHQRAALITHAMDLGITHFDTARFYGDGLSEAVLGKFLKKIRSRVTITSKFGLMPTPMLGSLGRAAMPLRKVRGVLRRLGIVEYPRRSYTRKTLQTHLTHSLRALGTDYIDIYCLHEPLLSSPIASDLFEDLARSKEKGYVRYIGVSGESVDGVVESFESSLDVIQTAEGSWSAARYTPDITHSLFAEAVRKQETHLSGLSIRDLLTRALARRTAGSVIVQTRHTSHLDQILNWSCGK